MTEKSIPPKDDDVPSKNAPHSLGEDIRARLPALHKGDVGGPDPANEQVYQGSKQTEFYPPSNPQLRK